MNVARPPEPLDNRVALETPEHVALSVSLAGVGARGAAWLVDTVVRVFVGFFLGLLFLTIGADFGAELLVGFSSAGSQDDDGNFTVVFIEL